MEPKPNQELHLEFDTDEEIRIFSLTQDEDENLISVRVDDGADKKLSVYGLNSPKGK